MPQQEVNDMAWWLGWNWTIVIIGFTILGLLIGFIIDLPGPLFIGGLILGMGAVVWGFSEINNNYDNLRNGFFERSRTRAEDRLGFDEEEIDESYNFRVGFGESPPSVDAPGMYNADHLFLSDVSVTVDRGSAYDLEKRTETNTGTSAEIYYDDIESVSTKDTAKYINIVIKTSTGSSHSVSSDDLQKAEAVLNEIRNRKRDNSSEES